MVPEDLLAFFRNRSPPIDRIVERNAKEPFDVDHRRDVALHVEHVPRIEYSGRQGLFGTKSKRSASAHTI